MSDPYDAVLMDASKTATETLFRNDDLLVMAVTRALRAIVADPQTVELLASYTAGNEAELVDRVAKAMMARQGDETVLPFVFTSTLYETAGEHYLLVSGPDVWRDD